MSDPNTLGGIVRRRRLESGYSLGQLASKVGKTAAEVRAWERDAELPEHGIIDRLAETLELDLDDIKRRLEEGKKALEAEQKAAAAAEEEAAAQQSADDEAAEPEASESEETESEEAAEDESEGAKPAVPVVFPAEDAETISNEDDLPGFAVDDPFNPPVDTDELEPVAGGESEFDLLDAPTEAVPVPIITETAAAARAGRTAALLEEPAPLPVVESAPDADPGLLRYLEPLRLVFDPNSRYLYWIRAGLTVVVMLIFAVVLLNQIGNLLDAIGELLDTIEPAAKDPDDLSALGFFVG